MPGVEEQSSFDGFLPEDFDAYLPEKWNSNMYTLPRRKVKGKLAGMGARLHEEVKAEQLMLVMHVSDEFPSLWNKKKVDSQWIFFSRDDAARAELTDLIDTKRTLADTLADPTPRYRHIFMCVAVYANLLEIGLHLHHDAWVDRDNLIRLLEMEQSRARFLELVAGLPEHYEVGVGGQQAVSPSAFGTKEVERLVAEFGSSKGWLFFGARLPKDQVSVLGAEVMDVAAEAFRLLMPLYRFIAWSPENDAISFNNLVAERHEMLRAAQAEFDSERCEREERRSAEDLQRRLHREEIEEKVRETQGWRKREVEARRMAFARAATQAKQETAKSQAEPKQDKPSAILEAKQAVPKTQETVAVPKDEIKIGDQVKVLKGFLNGRKGVVQEMDEKGSVRISFGILSSWLARYDVAVVGADEARGGAGREDKPSGKRQKK